MARTLEEIRQLGLAALRERLGRADTVRFIQQFTNGSGDYAKQRHAWVDETSLDEIQARSGAKTKPSRSKRSTKPHR